MMNFYFCLNCPFKNATAIKEIVQSKWKFCHHLFSLKLFQTCMNFFLLLNTKEDIVAFSRQGRGTTWGWVNDDRIYIFVWTIHLMSGEAICYFKQKYLEFKTAHLNLWKLPIIPLHITNPWQMDHRCPFHLFFLPKLLPMPAPDK